MNTTLAAAGRKCLAVAGIAFMLGSAAVGTSRADEAIDVKIDFAKILKLERSIATIVIGNPGIADATVQDDRTLVLTGKSAGSTNLIVLDESGEQVANAIVRVSSNTRQLTTVFYGGRRQTLSCSPTCEQVVSVGDDNSLFETARNQIEGRQNFSDGN